MDGSAKTRDSSQMQGVNAWEKTVWAGSETEKTSLKEVEYELSMWRIYGSGRKGEDTSGRGNTEQ
jgi:hypothetical protein